MNELIERIKELEHCDDEESGMLELALIGIHTLYNSSIAFRMQMDTLASWWVGV